MKIKTKLVGQRFGRLVVTKFSHENLKSGEWYWVCKCDCGVVRPFPERCITRGRSKSCGCLRVHDLTGKVFGRLTVVCRATHHPQYCTSAFWKCRCSCGEERIVPAGNLVKTERGTRSCGCYGREITSKRSLKHGHRVNQNQGTPEYRAWVGMKQRCENTNCKDYPNWGGRGISVCKKWSISFIAFFADMGPCPKGLTLDRKNNYGNYTQRNCRWTTRKVQQNNRRPFSEWKRRSDRRPISPPSEGRTQTQETDKHHE